MSNITSVSLCARVTMDMHNLNNEGTEGNQQQTRMVHIIDQQGQRAVVNAVSGDMFKHILVEHLTPLLEEAGEPLSAGAVSIDPDRINVDMLKVINKTREITGLTKAESFWLKQASEKLSKGAANIEDVTSDAAKDAST